MGNDVTEKKKPRDKKRWRLLLALFFVATAAAVGFFAVRYGKSATEATAVSPRFLTLDEKVEKILSSLSLGEKVGQMVMVGIHGTELDKDSRYLLSEFNFGGVILFDRNIKSKEQVASLNAALQKQAGKIPRFIAIDEEGGLVVRMREVLKPPPPAESIGRTGNPAEAARWAKYTADELKAMGFNLNFAPVADVGAGDGRSYSRDAAEVARFVKAAVESYADNGFLCTLKHFPGLGRGAADSHLDSVTVSAGKDELLKNDVVPFAALVKEQDNDSFFVMVSHLIFPAFDENPASLSRPIVSGLLREQLGYKGIIITDDMEMGAVAKHYGFDLAARQAVEAGVDIILVCHEYEHEISAFNGILKAVREGKIKEKRIDDSVRRILRVKLGKL